MKYFQNWHDLGEAGQRQKQLPEEKFQTMFGVKEAEICSDAWQLSDFNDRFSTDLLFVHFNGNIKVCRARCL
jgi:hypothetical protein